ncbi:DinB family protein [Tepidiforma flava]|uniref:DinB family protein n=1 Tax=Tepidiforma flava TaxID=3004094 RepID=A0ABY7M9E3_9CHLR|nr:DinB family protein [Tepidiforma flava]WBL36715.1 DinB family protein [Tepidiforma flava]
MTGIREMLIDGIEQLNDWFDDALKGLTDEQANWLPPGKTVSIGFNAWHTLRTQDDIVNFVLQGRKPTVWMSEGFAERLGLPPVGQGTGMSLEDARALRVSVEPLREYCQRVKAVTLEFVKNVPEEELEQIQQIRPLGEMPKWKVLRQVVMTHGFMHLGEVNTIKGAQGMGFSI